MNVDEENIYFKPVVLQLIPKSTLCKDNLLENRSDKYILENMGKVSAIEEEVAGIGRVFEFNMYRIRNRVWQDLEKSIYFTNYIIADQVNLIN